MGNDQKRALFAVVLSGLILFGWQYFYGPSQVVNQAENKTVSAKTAAPKAQIEKDNTADQASAPMGAQTSNEASEVTEVVLSNESRQYTLNSQMTVTKGLFRPTGSEMAEFFGPNNNRIQFLVGDVFKSINFKLESISDHEASFADNQTGIKGSVVLNSKGFLDYKFSSDRPFTYRFAFEEGTKDDDGGGFLSMSAGVSKKHFGYFTDEYNQVDISNDERGEAKIQWASVDNDYHIFANVFDDRNLMLFTGKESGAFELKSPEAVTALNYKQIFARKEYDQLGVLGHHLNKSIDFGIWGLIAVPILRGLQFFYSVIPNYGISIILLTIIIRMLTFPLQFKSFKSMKKMQEIQPELTKIKEKFKNDPQRMQQETMGLFKKAGANPLGGCLPMILQMPIFFAFYKVLYSSVELVDAPFFGWIHDLSQKDPYYVLPILMGLAMVLNQKLMPSTVSDPVQKKVMLFMPLIFAVFMKDFPAGLTLYIFVSTLMGMGQQLFVYKRT